MSIKRVPNFVEVQEINFKQNYFIEKPLFKNNHISKVHSKLSTSRTQGT